MRGAAYNIPGVVVDGMDVLAVHEAVREAVERARAGGVPTQNGARKVTIRLINQATYIPKGSRLTLTLASSSTAQSTSNLLYLDLPMAASARLRVGTAVLKLPGLRTPVTK